MSRTAPGSVLMWFRRDLRDADNAVLAAALAASRGAGGAVYCAFVFDRVILDALPSRADRRVAFIHASLIELDAALAARGGGLIVCDGDARDEIPRLAAALGVDAVYANRDYEPQAKSRDAAVAAALAAQGRRFVATKDQALFDGDEVLTRAGRPYTVFTPYRSAWLARLQASGVDCQASAVGRLAPPPPDCPRLPPLAALGFADVDLAALGVVPGMAGASACFAAFRERLPRYRERRDFPAADATSRLSVHLRFGTVSVRALVAAALQAGGEGSEDGKGRGNCGGDGASAWLSELAWRDFFFMILDRFPQVVDHAFRPRYDAIAWDDWPDGLAAWRTGCTGYPLVDAAMRALVATGFLHNRLRMLVASFLVKDLGIDWRLGERWFAEQLLDYDLAANNGNWQWVASTGCDAQPWFRIFNPLTQSEKFDPDGAFIRRYVPELQAVPNKWVHAPWKMPVAQQAACGVVVGRDYPAPLVEHDAARRRTLARYALEKSGLRDE